MEQEYEHYQKVKEVLARFPDSVKKEEKFHRSALFNKTVQMLARDVDPYQVMIDLINATEDTQKAFEYHLINCPTPSYIYK